MLKKLLATTALSALLASPVLAQVTQPADPVDSPAADTPATPAPADTPPVTPADDMPGTTADDPLDAPTDDPLGAPADDPLDAPANDMLDAPATEGAEFDTAPPVSAEELIGADVLDFDGQVVARVNDVVTGVDGEVETILINVGGFLGIGSRTVGIPFADVTVDADDTGAIVLRTPLSSDDISDLPEFEQQV